jgi:hypothetical protein
MVPSPSRRRLAGFALERKRSARHLHSSGDIFAASSNARRTISRLASGDSVMVVHRLEMSSRVLGFGISADSVVVPGVHQEGGARGE